MAAAKLRSMALWENGLHIDHWMNITIKTHLVVFFVYVIPYFCEDCQWACYTSSNSLLSFWPRISIFTLKIKFLIRILQWRFLNFQEFLRVGVLFYNLHHIPAAALISPTLWSYTIWWGMLGCVWQIKFPTGRWLLREWDTWKYENMACTSFIEWRLPSRIIWKFLCALVKSKTPISRRLLVSLPYFQ